MPRRRAYDISAAEARRIALAAQGFGRPRPDARITARHFERVLQHTGLVQIDSVNVLVRAHYMPFFSRLGPYDRAALDRFTWGGGRLFEFWGHEASFIPADRYPLFRHRMETGRRWSSGERFMEGRDEHARSLIEKIRESGPVIVGDVDEGGSQ
ncbi:MAG: crosslink repair DNA glycosylase YcaQ family protein, partial [Dehalococcoidia bacterium]